MNSPTKKVKVYRAWKRVRWGSITSVEVRELTLAFLIKGGFIKYLPDENDPGSAYRRARAKRSPDWGLMRKTPKKRGRQPYKRVQVYCEFDGCNRHIIAKGKTSSDALIQAWEKGWAIFDDVTLCRKHKPGKPDGRWRKGMVVYHRETGETYKVEEYLPRGEHVLNTSSWPELWCIDKWHRDKVFIFWKNEIPASLAVIGE